MPRPSACQFCLALVLAHPPLTRAPLAPSRAGGGRRQAGQPADCRRGPTADRRRLGTLPSRRAGPPCHTRGHGRRDNCGHPRLGDEHPAGAPWCGAAAPQAGQAAHPLRRPRLAHWVLAGGNYRRRTRGHHYEATGEPGGRGFRAASSHVERTPGNAPYGSQPDARAAGPARRSCGRTQACWQAVRDYLAPVVTPDPGCAEARRGQVERRHDECAP